VLLPGAFLMLREKTLPPIDALRRHGVDMAVASDCNPGTSPMRSARWRSARPPTSPSGTSRPRPSWPTGWASPCSTAPMSTASRGPSARWPPAPSPARTPPSAAPP
jgi:hypothetical protein